MEKGIVAWFNSEKGYGFIQAKGRDYFVHYTEIQGEGYKSLNKGMSVCFEPTDTPKGKVAKNVVKQS